MTFLKKTPIDFGKNKEKWLFGGWFVLSSLFYSWVILGPYGNFLVGIEYRLALLAIPIGISLVLLRKIRGSISTLPAFLLIFIGYGVVYKVITFLPTITSYPFTLTWSEGTAYYFASLFFSDQIYGVEANLPMINPTRHMLLAIPFLLPELPIWFHRLWEVVLWLLISGITVAVISRRLAIQENVIRWAFAGWLFLYLFQGPVYYFLLLSLIPVIWGFDGKNFKRTLLLVLIGSAWAGASRVNWVPVPALVAAALYFLEEKVGDQDWVPYLLKPSIWLVSGVVVAFLAWFGYILWSGNPIENFSAHFTSNLLWYRLLPNATMRGGILLTILIASIPLVGVIAVHLYKNAFNYHVVRRIGIGAILLVLFLGGLIVSTKIGGGNNIHNFDAYLIILLLTAAYLYFGKSAPDFNHPERKVSRRRLGILIPLAILIPAIFVLQDGRPLSLPRESRVEDALLTIEEYTAEVVSEGGEALFIAERQLLTFGELQDVPLLPRYERMNLMEMVMARNLDYLDEFHQRIENQDYDLIVSEPLSTNYKGRGEPFGDEHDIYVRLVAEPVLCYYEPVKTISKFPIQLLAPRPESEVCS